MGIAVLYLLSAIPFVGQSRPWTIWLALSTFAPDSALANVAFIRMTLNAESRDFSPNHSRRPLFEASQLRVKRDLVGSEAGDKIMDITNRKPPTKLITYFVYGGVGLMVIDLPFFALYSANAIIINRFLLVSHVGFLDSDGYYCLS